MRPDLRTLDITFDDLIENRETIFAMIRSLIGEMKLLVLKKGEDYSGTKHTWANFEESAEFGNLKPDQVFLALIGTKFSRILNLLDPESGAPNFESIDDSLLDMANYIILWAAYKRFLRKRF